MHVAAQAESGSKRRPWAGWILTALPALFLVVDGVMKLFKPAPVMEGTMKLGYPASCITGLGVALLISTILYLIPRTAVLGAILCTGYLGGAVASNLRVGNPWLGYILFPVYVAILLWLGLYLRDARLRQLVPLRK